jgi:hypothetical protein
LRPAVWWLVFASLIPSVESHWESAFTPKTGTDVEQEQTPMNREQAELTEKRLGFGKRSAGFQHGTMVK